MENISRDLISSSMTHMANFEKLSGTPPRLTPYLTDMKCTFFAMSTEGVIPLSDNGIGVQRWQAVILVYDRTKVPRRGDVMTNLRLLRTRELVKGKLTVVDVIPYRSEKTYMVLLTESADR